MHDRTPRTPDRHRAACDRAIAVLEHAAFAIGTHDQPGDPADTIDTCAARLILCHALEAIASELRLRMNVDETICLASGAE